MIETLGQHHGQLRAGSFLQRRDEETLLHLPFSPAVRFQDIPHAAARPSLVEGMSRALIPVYIHQQHIAIARLGKLGRQAASQSGHTYPAATSGHGDQLRLLRAHVPDLEIGHDPFPQAFSIALQLVGGVPGRQCHLGRPGTVAGGDRLGRLRPPGPAAGQPAPAPPVGPLGIRNRQPDWQPQMPLHVL